MTLGEQSEGRQLESDARERERGESEIEQRWSRWRGGEIEGEQESERDRGHEGHEREEREERRRQRQGRRKRGEEEMVSNELREQAYRCME